MGRCRHRPGEGAGERLVVHEPGEPGLAQAFVEAGPAVLGWLAGSSWSIECENSTACQIAGSRVTL
jgi:hypothetical protein